MDTTTIDTGHQFLEKPKLFVNIECFNCNNIFTNERTFK